MSFVDLSTPAGLQAFDEYIASKTYIQGYMPTTLDLQALSLFAKPPGAEHSHALRYYNHILSFSEDDRKKFRAGGEVPAQIAGSVKAKGAAPAAAPKAAAAPAKEEKKETKKEEKKEDKKDSKKDKAAAAPAPAAAAASPELEAAIKAQGEVVRKLKAEKASKEAIQVEVDKLLALKSGAAAPAAAAPAAAPAKEEKKDAKKDGKKEEKKDAKKEEKKDAKKEEKTVSIPGKDDKLIKAVEKEGGKKGQDIIGVHEMGGLEFFCTSVDTPDGDFDLLNLCLNAMNAEIDPESEEKRGGAAPVGKMIFSAGVKQLAIVAKIPDEKVSRLNLKEWLQFVVDKVGGKTLGEVSSTYGQAVVEADADKGRFPIKLKDIAIPAAVEYLQSKGLMPQSNDDSDDEPCFGDDAFDDM